MNAVEGKDATIRRRVLVGTASNYLGKLVTLAVWFFLTPFILKRLGESDYGLWVLVSALASYGWLLEFGIGNGVSKYVAEYLARGDREQAQRLVTTAFWLYSAAGLVAIGVSALLAQLFLALFNIPAGQEALARCLVLLSGLSLGISFPFYTLIAVLRGMQRYDVVNAVGIFGMALLAAGMVIALLLGGGLLEIVAVNVPVAVLVQIPAIWFIRRNLPELRIRLRGGDARLARQLLSYSFALFGIDLAAQLQARSGEVITAIFLPVSAVTPFSIVRRLSEIPQLVAEQFVKVLLPLASQLHAEEDLARLRGLYTGSTRLALAGYILVGCGVIVLARPFLALWVGEAYSPYAYLAFILIAAGLAATSQWPAALILQGIARHRYLAVVSLGASLANLALSAILIQRLGLLGVALGALIATFVERFILIFPYAQRVVGVDRRTAVWEMYLPALLPALPMVGALYALRELLHTASLFTILLAAGVGALVYAAFYLGFPASAAERGIIVDTAKNALRSALQRLRAARLWP